MHWKTWSANNWYYKYNRLTMSILIIAIHLIISCLHSCWLIILIACLDNRRTKIHLDHSNGCMLTFSKMKSSKKGDDRRPLKNIATCIVSDPRARGCSSRITSCRFAVDSWNDMAVDLKLAASMAPPPSPYMAMSRACTRLLWVKKKKQKGNNNNRSLPGTSWSRARSSSWNSSRVS